MKLKDKTDGNLILWLNLASSINKIGKCSLINSPEELRLNLIASLIVDSRANGANWIWSEDSIYQDEDDPDDDHYHLSPVDMAGYLELDSNNDLKKHLEENSNKRFAKKVTWDYEHSAWYPLFKKEEDAKECIKVFNKIFDDKYLKPLKKYCI